jgi:hypothetical protein
MVQLELVQQYCVLGIVSLKPMPALFVRIGASASTVLLAVALGALR